MRLFEFLSVSAVFLAIMADSASADDSYRTVVDAWRQRREAELKADDGWLTLAGLHWIEPGITHVGSNPRNEIQLPKGAPPRVGVLERAEDKIRFLVRSPMSR